MRQSLTLAALMGATQAVQLESSQALDTPIRIPSQDVFGMNEGDDGLLTITETVQWTLGEDARTTTNTYVGEKEALLDWWYDRLGTERPELRPEEDDQEDDQEDDAQDDGSGVQEPE